MPARNVSESLLQSRPFRYLNKEQISYVQSFGHLMEYHDGKVILSQGRVGAGLFVILRGRASVAIRVLGEERLTLAHMKEGDFFGEPNLLNRQQSTATVSAQQKTLCFHIPRICFDSFTFSAPKVRHAINRALVEDVVVRYRGIREDVSKLLSTHNMTKISLKMPVVRRSSPRIGDLADMTVLQDFEERDLKELVKHSKLLSIQDCSLIDRVINDACFLILDGAVMANIAFGPRRTHFAVHQPNTFVCPTSSLGKHEDIFSYNTCGPATLLEIPTGYLNTIMKTNLPLWFKFHDLFAFYIFDLQRNLNTLFARLTNENFF